MNLSQLINQRTAAPGTLARWWLGGSGFVFKTSRGTVGYIAPYLFYRRLGGPATWRCQKLEWKFHWFERPWRVNQA